MSANSSTGGKANRMSVPRRLLVLILASILAIGFRNESIRAGQQAILHLYSQTAKGEICLVEADDGTRRCLTDNRRFDYDAVWSPDAARVAWVQQTNDPRNPDIYVMGASGRNKLRLTRSPRDDEEPRWSPDGTQIVWNRHRGDSPTGRLFVMDSDGSNKRLLVGRGAGVDARWSPDGGRILFLSRDGCLDDRCANHQLDVHVVDADGTDEGDLTNSAADEMSATWSPDGSRIAFVRVLEGDDAEIFVMKADGSGVSQITDTAGSAFLPAWSPDGSSIAFTEITDPDNFETRLSLVDVGTQQVRVLTDEEVGGVEATWAPDGSYIAFSGHRSLGDGTASYEIHMIRPDGTELQRLTRTRGDEFELEWGDR